MARIELECKAEFTKWWYLAKAFKLFRIRYPKWMLNKTIAWVESGDFVRQIKLMEVE